MTSPKRLLMGLEIRPKKSLGQNFLLKPDIAQKIVDSAGIGPDDTVLEIGPGLGALTIPAARRAKKIFAVEKDLRLIDLLKTELAIAGVNNVEVIHSDILRVRFSDISPGNRVVVMGNLPYNISSQVMVKLIKERSHLVKAVIMLQDEFAARLVSAPGKKSYGRLSVMLGYCAVLRDMGILAPASFYPAPKVDSRVVKVEFLEKIKPAVKDEAFMFKVVKAAFSRRRKTLKNSLGAGDLVSCRDEAEAWLKRAGLDPRRRAETLTVEEFVRLTNCHDQFISS